MKALTCDEPMGQGRFPPHLHLHFLLLLQHLVVVVVVVVLVLVLVLVLVYRGDSTSLWACAPIQVFLSIFIPLSIALFL